MINYEWKLTSLKVANDQVNNLQNVIVQTHWECIGTDENGNKGTFVGATPFDLSQVDPNSFIPIDQLNEQIVLGWIQDVVNNNQNYKEHIDQRIARQIQNQALTTLTANSFPWSSGG